MGTVRSCIVKMGKAQVLRLECSFIKAGNVDGDNTPDSRGSLAGAPLPQMRP